jgi:transmembrane sensor
VTGIISETDEQHLQNTLQNYPDLKAEFEQLEKEYADWENSSAVQQNNSQANFELIKHELQRRELRKRKTIIYSLLSAAAVITFVALIYSIFPTPTQKQQQVAINKSLQLKLANGQLIDLSSKKDSISTDEASLSIRNHTLSYTTKNHSGSQDQLNSLWVPPGMDYHIELSDGTLVFINSASTLKFPFRFSGSTREVIIEGEAYLQVAKDPNRPFILHTPKGPVQVLGTSFNVNTYDSGVVKVSLVEGAVAFNDVKLKPGQAITYDNGNTDVCTLNENDLLWIKGRYKLDNTSLSEITKIIPRWYGVNVVIDSEKTAAKRFTGSILKSEPVEEFLDAIKLTTGVDYYYKDGTWHLR